MKRRYPPLPCPGSWRLFPAVSKPARPASCDRPCHARGDTTSHRCFANGWDDPVTPKLCTNGAFGLRFEYPPSWYGPEEYISGQTLRVEIRSDVVYLHGEPPEQPSDGKDSYDVVIEYTKDNQNSSWNDTYQSLGNLKDGKSLSCARSLISRVRQLDLGRFKGLNTSLRLPRRLRQTMSAEGKSCLDNEPTNDLLTAMGKPNNVAVSDGADWRDSYRAIDEANLAFFHEIVDSMTVG